MEYISLFLEKATRIYVTLMLTAISIVFKFWEHFENSKLPNPYDVLDGTF
jgi:hypothetical protein